MRAGMVGRNDGEFGPSWLLWHDGSTGSGELSTSIFSPAMAIVTLKHRRSYLANRTGFRTATGMEQPTPEHKRLQEDAKRQKNWKRWGTYLPERQWSTVREDYSRNGDAWEFFPHEHARSRAYRWGEDGLLGWCDRQCRICLAPALWNGADPILKERLFGLTNAQGNHGEDVKEAYYYLDATPTHSYARALYKYPQAEFPYKRLLQINQSRGLGEREFELSDTGIFEEERYFDVMIEYAKADDNDCLMRITATNRSPDPARLHVLPTIWFRNTWSWGHAEAPEELPVLGRHRIDTISMAEESIGTFYCRLAADGEPLERILFTDNNTNQAKLFQAENETRFVKDAFHDAVVSGDPDATHPSECGTKAAGWIDRELGPGETLVVTARISTGANAPASGPAFDAVFVQRQEEADAYYATIIPESQSEQEKQVTRQAYAGLLWSKQFYHYYVTDWLMGDPAMPKPPRDRRKGRNHEWKHVYAKGILSMPDKWEYPWFASWDLAFHMIPFCRIDPEFAKGQLLLLLREWYMHPNGQIPAYEFGFDDVNPPVHAWACWRVYKIAGQRGKRDRHFLEGAFQKLLLNFTWWVNRKDEQGNNLFNGGFLGLDNIGVFNRSEELPTGGVLQQADATAWMAFYCLTMLAISLELSMEDGKVQKGYADMASKFFEHFVQISDAINGCRETESIGRGLWDEDDQFYYDKIQLDNSPSIPLKVRSMVGLLPLIAVEVLDDELICQVKGFKKRFDWFMENRPELASQIVMRKDKKGRRKWLLAIASQNRLEHILRRVFDDEEFLSPHGIRSLSRYHAAEPYMFHHEQQEYWVDYVPGESNSYLFGGNSNWRGPVWFPVNFLLAEALERYEYFYEESLLIEVPGHEEPVCLRCAAREIHRRNASLFLADGEGHRPAHGNEEKYQAHENWRDLILFYEYFHGETGRGIGASHQTGWTALVTRSIEKGQETPT